MSDPRNVLVTGGAGYVGSHACKALAAAGYQPIVFDNLVYGHEQAVRWGPLEQGDISDRFRLDAVIERYRPEAVMHFAAYAYVGESVIDPGKYYRNNTAGTLTLLEAMRDHGIRRFVFSSTCATYGIPDEVPIPESTVQRPINPYGTSKLMVEMMLRDFDAAHELRSMALRYFNAAGADPDGETGERHEPETHLIPLALDAVTGNGRPLTVYGEDYPTVDGTCIRDYIHVSDLAEAHVLALEALIAQPERSLTMNCGYGRGFSVLEVLDAVDRVTNMRIAREIAPRRVGDPGALVSDPSRINATLPWKPRYADLPTIIEHALAWERRLVELRAQA